MAIEHGIHQVSYCYLYCNHFSIVDRAARQNKLKSCHLMIILKVFYLSTHKPEKCLRTAYFYCVFGTHKIFYAHRTKYRAYAIRIVISRGPNC